MEKIKKHFKEVWWAYALIPFVILYKSGYWDPTPEEIAAQKEIERVEAAKKEERARLSRIEYVKNCITRGLWVYPKQSNYFASFDFRSDGTWEMNNIRMGNSYKGTWSVGPPPYEVEITYTYSSRGRGTIPDNGKIKFGYGDCKDIGLGEYDEMANFVGTTYYRLGTF